MNNFKQNIKTILLLLTCITLLCSGCTAQETNPVKETETDHETVILLHTNDVHCGIDDRIGYDGLALYRKELEEKYDHVFLIDAGDAVQGGPYGSLSKGEAIIDLMNDVQYDVAALGNHEFDYGMDVLEDRSEQLKCGYTCANFCTADGEPVFQPYRILEAGNRKIGFVSVVTPETLTKTSIHTLVDDTGQMMYDFLADESGEALAECVQRWVDEVRKQNADTVILIAHLGETRDSDARFGSDTLISRIRGVDAVIDGHTHIPYINTVPDAEGNEVLMVQTKTKLDLIGRIDIAPDGTVSAELIDTVPKPENLPCLTVTRKQDVYVDPEVNRKILEMKKEFEPVMERKIGEAGFDLPIHSEAGEEIGKLRENGIHDLWADALYSSGECDLALVNSASVREGLQSETITYRDILNVLPYSNDVFLETIKGQDIVDALEWGARKLPEENAVFLQVSGLTYKIDVSIPSGAAADRTGNFDHIDGPYRVYDVRVNGDPIDPEGLYVCAMDSYVAQGGDGLVMLGKSEKEEFTGHTTTDLLAEYIETTLNGTIPEMYAQTQGRIVLEPRS